VRFDRVRLRNFKCYEDAEVALDPGVTVIHGLNGSGKSTLLEACFFALYGAGALDRTLEEVVTIGAEEAEIDLWFTHDGGEYHVHRRVRATGGRASTPDCILETPTETIEGVQDVEREVATLLRMDADAFVNCAYVRQGEVNKLINATPSTRQDMIDDLLQLGRLEEYRERAGSARLAVEDVLGERRGELESLDEQIAEKEAKDLHETLNEKRSALAEVREEIERFEANREEARETLADAEAALETHERRREELADLTADVEDLEDAIRETAAEREGLGEELTAARERRDEATERAEELAADLGVDPDADAVDDALAAVAEEREELQSELTEASTAVQRHESEAEAAAERAEDFATRADEARAEAADLDVEAEEAESNLAERREKLADLEAELAALRDDIAAAPVDRENIEDHLADLEAERETLRERETDLRADLESARDALQEAERLIEAGNCPTCGQPVADSPHVDAVDERRERVEDLEAELSAVREETDALEDRLDRAEELVDAAADLDALEERRDDVDALIEERATAVEEKRESADAARERAADLDAEAESARETAAEARQAAAAARERVADCNERNSELQDRGRRLEELADDLAAVAEAETEIEHCRERRDDLADRQDERRDRLADLREQRADLVETIDEDAVEEARAERDRAESYLEDVTGKLDDLEDRRDALQSAVGAVENELDELEELRERREAVADRVDALASLREEAADLEAMYGDLRSELRAQNVTRLEALLNETFELVYGNDSYTRIELSESYALTVYQKDGQPLDPDQLSGGERALFNLSLRTAIYRLLAEGIEGAAPMPPLILDEPTVFLDSGHVARLVDLVESMRSVGVEQIVVVSHDEELVAAADDVVRVEKDPTTNRSHVERAAAGTP
jgi:exonuclease SbcC